STRTFFNVCSNVAVSRDILSEPVISSLICSHPFLPCHRGCRLLTRRLILSLRNGKNRDSSQHTLYLKSLERLVSLESASQQ
ncbi:hypothetical protein NDU88_006165, partial [Pleurodeles waltl]